MKRRRMKKFEHLLVTTIVLSSVGMNLAGPLSMEAQAAELVNTVQEGNKTIQYYQSDSLEDIAKNAPYVLAHPELYNFKTNETVTDTLLPKVFTNDEEEAKIHHNFQEEASTFETVASGELVENVGLDSVPEEVLNNKEKYSYSESMGEKVATDNLEEAQTHAHSGELASTYTAGKTQSLVSKGHLNDGEGFDKALLALDDLSKSASIPEQVQAYIPNLFDTTPILDISNNENQKLYVTLPVAENPYSLLGTATVKKGEVGQTTDLEEALSHTETHSIGMKATGERQDFTGNFAEWQATNPDAPIVLANPEVFGLTGPTESADKYIAESEEEAKTHPHFDSEEVKVGETSKTTTESATEAATHDHHEQVASNIPRPNTLSQSTVTTNATSIPSFVTESDAAKTAYGYSETMIPASEEDRVSTDDYASIPSYVKDEVDNGNPYGLETTTTTSKGATETVTGNYASIPQASIDAGFVEEAAPLKTLGAVVESPTYPTGENIENVQSFGQSDLLYSSLGHAGNTTPTVGQVVAYQGKQWSISNVYDTVLHASESMNQGSTTNWFDVSLFLNGANFRVNGALVTQQMVDVAGEVTASTTVGAYNNWAKSIPGGSTYALTNEEVAAAGGNNATLYVKLTSTGTGRIGSPRTYSWDKYVNVTSEYTHVNLIRYTYQNASYTPQWKYWNVVETTHYSYLPQEKQYSYLTPEYYDVYEYWDDIYETQWSYWDDEWSYVTPEEWFEYSDWDYSASLLWKTPVEHKHYWYADGVASYYIPQVIETKWYSYQEYDVKVTYTWQEEVEVPVIPPRPEIPEIPEVPEVPEVPEIPETPEVPEIPETPETPTPPTVLGEIEEKPETPDTPDTPEEGDVLGEINDRQQLPDAQGKETPKEEGSVLGEIEEKTLPNTGEHSSLRYLTLGAAFISISCALVAIHIKKREEENK